MIEDGFFYNFLHDFGKMASEADWSVIGDDVSGTRFVYWSDVGLFPDQRDMSRL